jgi:hypothetical protein
MRRSVWMLVAVALLATACENPLGRGVPECGPELTSSMVLQVQALPGSQYVSCINGLKTGWAYMDLEAESGHSEFKLSSDRLGQAFQPFVTIESVLSCDPGDAEPAPSGYRDVRLFKDVQSETTVAIALVPEGPTPETQAYAAELAGELSDAEIKDRTVVVTVSISTASSADRIRSAAARGAHVIDISIRDAEEGTLSLLLAGQSEEIQFDSLDKAIKEIENAVTPPSYRGSWYYVFAGGCVVYTFDATGPEVNTIDADITIALGLYDAEALRQRARDDGYDI